MDGSVVLGWGEVGWNQWKPGETSRKVACCSKTSSHCLRWSTLIVGCRVSAWAFLARQQCQATLTAVGKVPQGLFLGPMLFLACVNGRHYLPVHRVLSVRTTLGHSSISDLRLLITALAGRQGARRPGWFQTTLENAFKQMLESHDSLALTHGISRGHPWKRSGCLRFITYSSRLGSCKVMRVRLQHTL